MKRIKIKLLAALTAFALFLGIGSTTITAGADEVTESPEIVTETPEISTDTETDEETPDEDEEDVETTFEGFLEWSKTEAEKYGYGNEYAAALETIKTAATQKQVTISTVASFALVAAVLVYIVYKKVTDKKFRKNVEKLSGDLSGLYDKVNELVDGVNANEKTEGEIKESATELKAEIETTGKALATFIRSFMHFADGIALKDAKKAEVQMDCINALKKLDGEVTGDEDNQK